MPSGSKLSTFAADAPAAGDGCFCCRTNGFRVSETMPLMLPLLPAGNKNRGRNFGQEKSGFATAGKKISSFFEHFAFRRIALDVVF
jgi:hypothetical protein